MSRWRSEISISLARRRQSATWIQYPPKLFPDLSVGSLLPFSAVIDSSSLSASLLADIPGFRKRLRGLEQRRAKGLPFDEGLARLQRDVETSMAVVAQRQAFDSQIDFPEELPISAKRVEIADLIQAHQVVVLCGETGSGKSTQLPKLCLSLGRGVLGRIGHSQPRRIAARSLAGRISTELGQELGTRVGYKVRFKDRVLPQTQIKLLTDGMLLAEVQQDRWLNEYDTLIIDEAHERSLNIDFLLGYLKQLLPKRPDLKLIVTSATIDPERFSRFFGNAPIINVSGRTFPVEVRYRPPTEEGAGERDESAQQALVDAVDELSREPWGDILVFLSGEREIREAAEALRNHQHRGIEILPLYARLSSAEQARIFQPKGGRRIILATNVAETSLTVPGIRNVIDLGFARISRYSPRSKIQRLPVERIARSSADQRKGRCGRVAAGICIRLYSEEDFEARAEFTEPEILRTNLASVILQMKVLGFGDIGDFPFIDPPDSRLIKDGYRVLEEISAVDGQRQVTRMGRQLARLPLDPRIGRMLLAAVHQGCLREVLVIAAVLSVQDPRERPLEKQQQADEAHALFKDENSDFMAFVALWDFLEEKRRHLSKRQFQTLCQRHFLSRNRVQEWQEIHQQLRLQLHDMGHRENEKPAEMAQVHQALLTGLLSHLGCKAKEREKGYQGARNSHFHLFPGSGLFDNSPKWVMAAELVETSRLYARVSGRIEPQWIERAAGHLLSRSYSEPHWQSRRGQVGGYEKLTLFGLVIVPRRRTNYGPLFPEESREIFLRSALVEGDFHSKAPFWRHNQELIQSVHDLEAKARRRDILVDEERLYAFYDQRIPEGIYSTPQFDQWLREISKTQPKLLHMRLTDIMREESGAVDADAFPDQLAFDGLSLPLAYAFDPGVLADGVTLLVPLAVLNQVQPEWGDWGVPGLLQEKITALLRALPKSLRKSFVPVPDYARRLSQELEPGSRSLVRAMGERLKQMTGVHVPEEAWDLSAIPEHLNLNYRVVDDAGVALAEGRDLLSLQRQLRDRAKSAFAQREPEAEPQGMRDWDCGPLAESVDIQRGGVKLKGYPALVDEGDGIGMRVWDAQAAAEHSHRQGLRRLLLIRLGRLGRDLKKCLPNLQAMRLQYALVEGAGQRKLEEVLVDLILDRTFIEDRPPIRDAEAFQAALDEGRGELMTRLDEVCALVAEILTTFQRIRKALGSHRQINWMVSLTDMRDHLHRLLSGDFLLQVPTAQLSQYPRYLRALELRLGKLSHAAARDQRLLQELTPLHREWLALYQRNRAQGRIDERLEEMRWLFEELRISLFAQEVGTAFPVSLKRLEKRWRELGF